MNQMTLVYASFQFLYDLFAFPLVFVKDYDSHVLT